MVAQPYSLSWRKRISKEPKLGIGLSCCMMASGPVGPSFNECAPPQQLLIYSNPGHCLFCLHRLAIIAEELLEDGDNPEAQLRYGL